jgi:hypothetical protein
MAVASALGCGVRKQAAWSTDTGMSLSLCCGSGTSHDSAVDGRALVRQEDTTRHDAMVHNAPPQQYRSTAVIELACGWGIIPYIGSGIASTKHASRVPVPHTRAA